MASTKWYTGKKRAFQIDSELLRRIREAKLTEKSQLFELYPSGRGNADKLEDMFREVHKEMTTSRIGKNLSPINSIEFWYDTTDIKMRFYLGDDDYQTTFRNQLDLNFENARLEPTEQLFFTGIQEDEFVSACEFKLQNHFWQRINEDENFHEQLFGHMTDKKNTREMVQFLFRPVREGWTNSIRRDVDEYAEELKENLSSYDGSDISNIKSQDDGRKPQKAFYVSVRLIVVSRDKQTAKEQTKRIANTFEERSETSLGQKLVDVHKYGADIEDFLLDVIYRRPHNGEMDWPQFPFHKRLEDRKWHEKVMIMSVEEFVNLAGFPSESDVEEGKFQWNEERGESVPRDLPEFNRYRELPEENEEDEGKDE